MSNLFEFLTNLATDPKKQETFAQNPQAMMEAARLSEADKVVVTDGDTAKIAAVFANGISQLAVIVTEPGPDPLPDPDPPSPDSPPDENPLKEAARALVHQHT